jgi:DNA-binding PadR family transcriptional regulator
VTRKRDRTHRILEVLAAADRDLYGRDLGAAGVTRRGWLYVALARMEDRGLIEGREDDGDPPRRLYRITGAGRAVLVPVLPVAKVR